MTLSTAVVYALEHPGTLPNRGGEYACSSCGRTFHQTHDGCPACGADLRTPMVA